MGPHLQHEKSVSYLIGVCFNYTPVVYGDHSPAVPHGAEIIWVMPGAASLCGSNTPI